MDLDPGLIKKLLMISAIIGVLQGLLTLVGNIIACFDGDLEKPESVRGWFNILHKGCGESEEDCVAGQDSFQLIMSIAVVCGVFWITAGVLSYMASSKMTQSFSQYPFILFAIGYIIFVGLFGAVMININLTKPKYEEFSEYNKSSTEFTAYSGCAFIFIFVCIVFTFLALTSLPSDPKQAYKSKHTPATLHNPATTNQTSMAMNQ